MTEFDTSGHMTDEQCQAWIDDFNRRCEEATETGEGLWTAALRLATETPYPDDVTAYSDRIHEARVARIANMLQEGPVFVLDMMVELGDLKIVDSGN